ncbi:Helix-turn-helix domain-containing protein [Actinacidiphila yanglinensis]|uniref:Helix-turn-helix domain-containing protein n=1 Tax=Actinacidiphila yanglinensis TaxID=310779 RepID=A0A1H5T0M7_9ACTN|nr:XRE family transcriptional regulator [Actinacidiphila yanglinensis]SEF55728.1 Helix-turn-helix domain-containing protein [Actinacidiphila yanglinensis]
MIDGRGLSPEAARLARELRGLRERTGLTLAALAARTTYSKSSWERYLNGKALPPRSAVTELCALADEPPRRLTVLLQLATRSSHAAAGPEDAGPVGASAPAARAGAVADSAAPNIVSRNGTSAVTTVPPPSAPGPPGRPAPSGPASVRWRGVRRPAVVVALGCVLAAGLCYALWPSSGPAPGPAATCQGPACDGKSPASTFCGVHLVNLTTFRATGRERIDIHYSRSCDTAWARLSRSRVGDRITVSAGTGRSWDVRVTDGYDAQGYVYTPMAVVDAHRKVTVCLRPSTGAGQCFAARAPSGG